MLCDVVDENAPSSRVWAGAWSTDRMVQVWLPSTLVDELSVFWAGRGRSRADVLACYAVCKVWLRRVTGLTARQLAEAAHFATVLSFRESAYPSELTRRLLDGEYRTPTVWLILAWLTMAVIGWLQLFPVVVRRLVEPMRVPVVVSVFDWKAMMVAGWAHVHNAVSHYTEFEPPVVDCLFYHLPVAVFYQCADQVFVSNVVEVALLVVTLGVAGYVFFKNRRLGWLVVTTLVEEVCRHMLAYACGSHVWSSMTLALFDGLLTWRWQAVVEHALLGLVSSCPLQCALLHVVLNVSRRTLLNVPFNAAYWLSNCDAFGGMLDDKGKMRCPQYEGDPYKTTCSQYLYGVGSGGYRPVAYAPNYNNECVAVKARVLALTPHVDLDVMNECIRWLMDNAHRIFRGFWRVKSVTFEKYLERSNASGSVKRQLRRTMQELREAGVDENTPLSPEQLHKWTRRKSFVKVENNVYRTPAGKKPKACRLIQGATPEFICLVGPWVMAYQGVIKKHWGKDNFICFTSGVSNLEAAHVIDVDGWRILEDDVGAFDASVCTQLLSFEAWLMHMFGAPRAVLQLVRANIKTHGYTSKGIKYSRKGMRKSGDPYTSVGNSLLNGLLHLYIYHRLTGCTVYQARERVRMVVQGDDNLLRHVGGKLDWRAWMAKLGFDAVAIYRDNIEDVEFCSNLLYKTRQGLVFSPKPGRVMAKLGYFINPPKKVTGPQLVRGTALGLYNACYHVLPLRVYLDRLLELTDGVVPHRVPIEDWKMRYVRCDLSQDCVTLERRYGWTNLCQEEFQRTVARMQLGQDILCPLFDLLCDRDTSGPKVMF